MRVEGDDWMCGGGPMPAQRRSRIPGPRQRRTAMLVLAAAWLALLLGICAVGPTGLSSPTSALAKALGTPPTLAVTITPPTIGGTATPTDTPPGKDKTPTPSATEGTPTGTATSTATATDTATAGSTDNGGGNYGEQSGGAEPTKVVFTQPTGGDSNGGPLQGLTSGAF